MKRENTIYDFVGQVFMIFGFTIACMNVFCILFGESAKEFSSMYALGGQGLTVATMMQLLILSVLIVALRYFFFTDLVLKKASTCARTLGMFTAIICVIVNFVFGFGWFPVDMWQPWVMFILCFIICAGSSAIVSVFKERTENRKLEEALERLKQEACEGINE